MLSPACQFSAFWAAYFGLLAAGGWAARRSLRRSSAAGPSSACVIVAAKGGGPGLEENAAAMLDQDFDGSLEYVFVVPRREDKAFARLQGQLAASARPARVVVSDARPERTTELILNFVHGAQSAGPGAQTLVFAPCDVRPSRRWVRELVAPLADPGVGASTATVLCVPEGRLLPGALKALWIASASAFHALQPTVSGQSFALRARDFEAWRVAERWSSSLVEDIVTGIIVRERGLRVALAGAATPCSVEPADWSDLAAGFSRWFLFGRVYIPWRWAAGGALACAKCAVVLWMARFPGLRPPLASFLAADALAAWLLLSAFAPALEGQPERLRRRFRRLRLAGALAMPLLAFVFAWNFLLSCLSRSFVWSGWRYTVRGPGEVLAEPVRGPADPS